MNCSKFLGKTCDLSCHQWSPKITSNGPSMAIFVAMGGPQDYVWLPWMVPGPSMVP